MLLRVPAALGLREVPIGQAVSTGVRVDERALRPTDTDGHVPLAPAFCVIREREPLSRSEVPNLVALAECGLLFCPQRAPTELLP